MHFEISAELVLDQPFLWVALWELKLSSPQSATRKVGVSKEEVRMDVLIIAVLWVVNLGISFWNARAVGLCWVEAKHAGGYYQFMAWIGAIMAASGFTWCILIFAAIGAGMLGFLEPDAVVAALSLGYLILIPGILFAGYVIMLDSWARAYRERSWTNLGVAGYNTFANAYNTYHAISGVGQSFGNVSKFFSGSDRSSSKNSGALLVILLVVLALLAGILITAAIISHYAASEPLPARPRR